MEKEIFKKEKKKEVRVHLSSEATPFEKAVMNTTITIAYFVFLLISFYLQKE